MQTIHRNVCMNWVFLVSFTRMFVIIVIYVYFTYISQGSVEMHLQFDGIYNNATVSYTHLTLPTNREV